MKKWEKAQVWELDWHGQCVNSYNEERKQLEYAKRMGLMLSPNPYTDIRFDLHGDSILDIGGGPYSLLLKCDNFTDVVVADPLMDNFPKWVRDRYKAKGIKTIGVPGESLSPALGTFDQVWIYNVLQHTKDPEQIINNAKKLAGVIRIFEWIDTPTNIGHLHTLTKENLDKWLGGYGKVEQCNGNGLHGKCYYGIFPV